MSQENVEIVRAAVETFNRGDVEAALKDVIPSSSSTRRGPSAWTVACSTSNSSEAC
jgi:invasion protein IalB